MELSAKIRNVEKNVVAESTRDRYKGPQEKFLLFLLENKPELLSPTLREALLAMRPEMRRKHVKKILVADLQANADELAEPCPFVFGNGKEYVTQVKAYVVSLNTGQSSRQTAQSALKDLLRIYQLQYSFEQKGELSTFRKGLKNTLAGKNLKEGGKLTEGKEHLPVVLYTALAHATLCSGKKISAFLHLVLVLSWNLGARVKNVLELCLAHFGWADDAAEIRYAQQKADQQGESGAHIRHVYANPLNPAVCPILASGVFFLLNPKEEGDTKVFQGSSQYNHFLSAMQDLFRTTRNSGHLRMSRKQAFCEMIDLF